MMFAFVWWYLIGFVQVVMSTKCKPWRRDIKFEELTPKGVMLLMTTTSEMYKCAVLSSNTDSCDLFSYDQSSGTCSRFRSVTSTEPDSIHVQTIPIPIFFLVELVQYSVTVKTSDSYSAGTNAGVFMKMYGTKGVSDEVELVDDTDEKLKFSKGNADVFNITVIDVGQIKKIKIGHNDKGSYSAWTVSWINIAKQEHSDVLFTINQRLQKSTQLYVTVTAP